MFLPISSSEPHFRLRPCSRCAGLGPDPVTQHYSCSARVVRGTFPASARRCVMGRFSRCAEGAGEVLPRAPCISAAVGHDSHPG
eukprot:3569188-Prymnesium_polylepis.1